MATIIASVGGLQGASRIAGVSDEQIARWRDGKSKPNFFGLFALTRQAGYSIEWLATGEGPMRGDEARCQIQTQTQTPAASNAPPNQTAPLDGRLLGLCFEGVRRTYREVNARIDDRAAGELAARLYADVIASTEGDTDPDVARPALRMGLRQLRRELKAPPGDVSTKYSA